LLYFLSVFIIPGRHYLAFGGVLIDIPGFVSTCVVAPPLVGRKLWSQPQQANVALDSS
jgi:hypothetical protein